MTGELNQVKIYLKFSAARAIFLKSIKWSVAYVSIM